MLPRLFPPLLDLGGWRSSVVLASAPRSGSTWVLELLNHENAFRPIFEPLHPTRVPELSDARLRAYRRPEEEAPDVEALLGRLLSGQLESPWMDRFNRRWVSCQRLVKTVRGNLMLPWLAEKFPGLPIVLLLRHPCAVAASRKRLGWGSDIAPLLEQPALCRDYLRPHLAAMRSEDPFERQVYRWAVHQLVPLSLLKPGQALVVFYEDLVAHPEAHLPLLFAYARARRPERAVRGLRRPSVLTKRSLTRLSSAEALTRWQASVSAEQRARADRVLEQLGLDVLYGPSGLPLPRAAAAERFPCLGFYAKPFEVGAWDPEGG